MSRLRLFLFALAVLGCIGLTSSVARACGCYQIWADGPFNCVGAGGCNSSYYVEYPTDGCIQGDWYATGAGSCCGKPYKTYNIDAYQCDPQRDCGECQGIRARGESSSTMRARTVPERPSGVKTGLSMGTRPKSNYQFDDLVFVPDRCGGGYRIVNLQEPGRRKSSAASSQAVSVPTGGDL